MLLFKRMAQIKGVFVIRFLWFVWVVSRKVGIVKVLEILNFTLRINAGFYFITFDFRVTAILVLLRKKGTQRWLPTGGW
jgi:hypothetical protein